LEKYKSPGSDLIPAEFIQAGVEILLYETDKLINCVQGKEELLEQWKEYIIVPVYMKGDNSDCSNYQGISLL
jgi:hypothetical protein